MGLDGLRAWIGEVERKLGVRTKVMLVLAVIAIGGAGAAIYLAIDTRDSAVSETDVKELQQQLETQIGTGGVTGTSTAQLESELRALKAEVEALRNEDGASESGGASSKDKGSTSGGASTGSGGASTGNAAELSEKLEELAEGAGKETK